MTPTIGFWPTVMVAPMAQAKLLFSVCLPICKEGIVAKRGTSYRITAIVRSATDSRAMALPNPSRLAVALHEAPSCFCRRLMRGFVPRGREMPFSGVGSMDPQGFMILFFPVNCTFETVLLLQEQYVT